MTPKMLSVLDIADSMGVHEQTVRKYIRVGDLVATPIGRRILVHPDDYADFLERHRNFPAAS